uniref:AGAP011412-PA n=1 Tax=Acartia pacifica TaxID=335913 RepID=A0A0U2T7D0_ACAPC|nr:AGAP011412-PA [Acartia pacifica]
MGWLEVFTILLAVPAFINAQSSQRRCYVCRSRGDRGDCRDPFLPPEARSPGELAPAHNSPITELPCASGWCAKMFDGVDKNTIEDYDLATERFCLSRGPSDGQERCTYVFSEQQRKEVYMCMCRGDLCNSARPVGLSTSLLLLLPLLAGALQRL